MENQEDTRDTYYREWYRKQFELLNFETNKFKCEVVDLMQQVKLLRKQVAEVEDKRSKDAAAIGELMERMDKSSEAFRKLREDIKELKSIKVMA